MEPVSVDAKKESFALQYGLSDSVHKESASMF
jgi:hypothetical protein